MASHVMNSRRFTGPLSQEDKHTVMQSSSIVHKTLNESELALFRTLLCEDHQRGVCFNADSCPRSHCLTWQRRDPYYYYYSSKLCPEIEFVKKGSKMNLVRRCNKGRTCNHAHSKEEELYHPLMYKTKMCSAFPNCNRCYCPFAHSEDEIRRPFKVHRIKALWGRGTQQFSSPSMSSSSPEYSSPGKSLSPNSAWQPDTSSLAKFWAEFSLLLGNGSSEDKKYLESEKNSSLTQANKLSSMSMNLPRKPHSYSSPASAPFPSPSTPPTFTSDYYYDMSKENSYAPRLKHPGYRSVSTSSAPFCSSESLPQMIENYSAFSLQDNSMASWSSVSEPTSYPSMTLSPQYPLFPSAPPPYKPHPHSTPSHPSPQSSSSYSTSSPSFNYSDSKLYNPSPSYSTINTSETTYINTIVDELKLKLKQMQQKGMNSSALVPYLENCLNSLFKKYRKNNEQNGPTIKELQSAFDACIKLLNSYDCIKNEGLNDVDTSMRDDIELNDVGIDDQRFHEGSPRLIDQLMFGNEKRLERRKHMIDRMKDEGVVDKSFVEIFNASIGTTVSSASTAVNSGGDTSASTFELCDEQKNDGGSIKKDMEMMYNSSCYANDVLNTSFIEEVIEKKWNQFKNDKNSINIEDGRLDELYFTNIIKDKEEGVCIENQKIGFNTKNRDDEGWKYIWNNGGNDEETTNSFQSIKNDESDCDALKREYSYFFNGKGMTAPGGLKGGSMQESASLMETERSNSTDSLSASQVDEYDILWGEIAAHFTLFAHASDM